MKHVFVETNWVVDYASPAHHQKSDAADLLERARRGELKLHLPAICLTEARHPIRKKCAPRHEADAIREFLPWAAARNTLTAEDEQVVRRVLGMFENKIKGELDQLPLRLEQLRTEPCVDAFAMNDAMLHRCLELTELELSLQPFDQEILAAILVRAGELRAGGDADRFAFCELDHHLQPWDKNGNAKQPLTDLYDDSRIWVYGDYTLSSPTPYEGWPGA